MVSLTREAYGLINAMPPNSPAPPQPNGYDYPTQPSTPTAVDPTPPTQQLYDFIVNPEPAPRESRIPGGNSKIVRIMIVLGGLLILFVLFSFVKGLIGGGSNTPYLLKVTQDQQQLIHLTTNASKENSLSEENANFAITTNLSIASSQTELITYMAKNGKKIKKKELLLMIDPQTDAQLTASVASNSYNQTFREVMKQSLNTYMSDLQRAFAKTKGKNGQALLTTNYDQAKLLLTKLEP